MSQILERAKAHYQSTPRMEISISEWGTPDRPEIVTWTALTVHEQDKIYAATDGVAPGGGTVRLRAVILKACDQSGKRLFDDMHEHDLRYAVSGDILGRIANAILYGAGIKTKAGATIPADTQVENAKNG